MDFPQPLILVIDDSEDIREIFRIILEGAGYRVKVAADGREGLEAVRECRPDLIVTDISMPGMNGFQFLVRLRSDFAAPLPPVIVCSGFDVTAEEALRLGASRFVAKPVESASLVSIVKQVLGGQPADESTLAHEREFVQAARARAAAAAARLFATIEAQISTVEKVLPILAQLVSDYFGFAHAAITFVEGGGIRVAAVSHGSFIPAGTTFSGRMLFSTGVLAGGSSLVVTDAAAFFGATIRVDAVAAAVGLEFLVAVPLVYDDIPIGALCLFDRVTHSFEAEDLLILEGIGREASRRLKFASPLSKQIGLLSPSLFDRTLGAELSLLHRERGGLELLLVEMEPAVINEELTVELMKRGCPRLALCSREPGTLAIYKRNSNAAAARSAIADSLSTLVATGAVRATGWISVVDAALPQVPRDTVLRLADLALNESQCTSDGRVERVLIVGEPAPEEATTAGPPAGAG